ncbi:MAG: glycoside hydrolase family 5 protein [Armatimonadota bacterium]
MVRWLIAVGIFWWSSGVVAAPWMTPDWQGREPSFPLGSLFWRTNEFQTSPILYRASVRLPNKPLDYAAIRLRARQYLYLFVTRFDRSSDLDPFGECIARIEAPKERSQAEVTLVADLTPYLRGRQAVALLVSAPGDGFSMEGAIVFQDGEMRPLVSTPHSWRAQKFPPLAVLEFEPCMKADFDDSGWFPVSIAAGEPDAQRLPQLVQELRPVVERSRRSRLLVELDEAKWRFALLHQKGIVLVDDEPFGWAGAERLPEWLRELAAQLEVQCGPASKELAQASVDKTAGRLTPSELVLAGQVLSLFVWARDEVTNVTNHVALWRALRQPQREKQCSDTVKQAEASLARAGSLVKQRRWGESVSILKDLRRQLLNLRGKGQEPASEPVINNLNGSLENKFGWLDTTVLLDNAPSRWGLKVPSPATVFASPLSPAALVTLHSNTLTLTGWNDLEPLRVYQKPAATGPVCLWLVLNGKVTSLRPQQDGTVYDRQVHGRMSENWMLLVHDLARGGGLPIQIVFLNAPAKVTFQSGTQGTNAVTFTFDQPGVRLFILKPLKEWRGLLYQAQAMTRSPLNEQEVEPYVQQCRLWSRALLHYPVTYSEAFVHDPQDRDALIVANAYNYWQFRDEWGTEPLRIASLPPLASYGLLRGYPGLQVLSEAERLGSWGIWGDHIAVKGKEVIVYRVPIHPIKRFGGFTAFCFGPTDVGEPGSMTELDLIKRTGANSFRPQHNHTGEQAMRTVQWCLERGLQHVFNTDEKWLPDVVTHYRILAEQCKDLPSDAVAYDLLNEPETRGPKAYNALLRRITKAIREVDKTHLIYAEVIAPWGIGAQPYPESAFANLEPTGDPLTVYSFHDYEYRLTPRYPDERVDGRNLIERWLPAVKFSIDHRVPIHLGEFGGFEQTEEDIYMNRCAITMLLDHFHIFDRFGWHFHYYSNRGVLRVRQDGSIEESLVQEAFRRYFGRRTLNAVRGH